MKNFYLAITEVCDDDRNYAFVIKANKTENLLSVLKRYNLKHVNICETRKEAKMIVESWNKSYIDNGTAPDWYLNAPLF